VSATDHNRSLANSFAEYSLSLFSSFVVRRVGQDTGLFRPTFSHDCFNSSFAIVAMACYIVGYVADGNRYHKVSQSCSEEGICCAVNYWYDMDYSGAFYPLTAFAQRIEEMARKSKS
jgi:hypothetical protein